MKVLKNTLAKLLKSSYYFFIIMSSIIMLLIGSAGIGYSVAFIFSSDLAGYTAAIFTFILSYLISITFTKP